MHSPNRSLILMATHVDTDGKPSTFGCQTKYIRMAKRVDTNGKPSRQNNKQSRLEWQRG